MEETTLILRNKRAEQIFTLFIFMLVTFFSTSFIFSYIFTGLLARLSLKWTFVAVTLTLIYSSQQRALFSFFFDLFHNLGFGFQAIITISVYFFSIVVNIGIWRLVGVFVFKKIRKRIPTDVVS